MSGYYGENCTNICTNCLNNKTCNNVNGNCTDGCSEGFKGDACTTGTGLDRTTFSRWLHVCVEL